MIPMHYESRTERRKREREERNKLQKLTDNYVNLQKNYERDLDDFKNKMEAEMKECLSHDIQGLLYTCFAVSLRRVTELKKDAWGTQRIQDVLFETAGIFNEIEKGKFSVEELVKEAEDKVGIRVEFARKNGKRFIKGCSFEGGD